MRWAVSDVVRSVIAATVVTAFLAGEASAACTLAGSSEPCTSPWIDQGAKLRVVEPSPPRTDPDDETAASDLDMIEGARPDHRYRSLAIVGGLYAGFITWAEYAWYKQRTDHGFEWGNDGWFGKNTYAGGADKLGHAWANLVLGRASSRLLRKGGWGDTGAAVFGGSLAWTLFLFVEIKDGYAYQFSPGDLTFNTGGAVLGALMEIYPRLDALIDYRVAYAPSDEYIGLWHDEYYGSVKGNSLNIAEDYSGQTYYLALHLGALPRPRGTPAMLATALSVLDVGVAFESRKYKPDAPPDSVATQELFLGVTLDLQRLSDRVLAKQRIPRKIAHGILEVMSPPYSIAPVLSQKRAATGPVPEQ
jgi:hypothetical protein